MGFFKKIGKGLKKVGRKLKRGVKKLGQNLKKYGPQLLSIGSMFIPGGGLLSGALGKMGGGMLGKVGGGLLSKIGSGGGFLGKMAGGLSKLSGGGGGLLGKIGSGIQKFTGGRFGGGMGLFGKSGGFLSGGGKLSGLFGKIKDFGKGSFLDPSGDGLWGGGQLMEKFGGGQGGGGMGGLLSSAMGGMGAFASPDLNYDINSIRGQYAPSSRKAEQLEKYYRDMADPNSAMNQKISNRFNEQSMDQAAMAELAAERRTGGATTGMQNEALSEIYDNAAERGASNFSNYMLGQTGQAGQGLASTLPYWQQIDNEAASLAMANQQHGFQQDTNKYGAINEIGGGLLDYGLGQLFPQNTDAGAYHGPYNQDYYQ